MNPRKSSLKIKLIKCLNQQAGIWEAGSDPCFAMNFFSQSLLDPEFSMDLNAQQNGFKCHENPERVFFLWVQWRVKAVKQDIFR